MAESSAVAVQQTMGLAMLHNSFNFEPFDPAVCSFNRWVQRLEGAFAAFQVEESKKVAYFLHYIGAKAFDTVCDKLTPEDPYQQAYMRLRKILEEFYSPMPLEIAENFRFHQRKQREEESLQEYIVALQKLSVNCKFGDYLKTAKPICVWPEKQTDPSKTSGDERAEFPESGRNCHKHGVIGTRCQPTPGDVQVKRSTFPKLHEEEADHKTGREVTSFQ